MLRSSSSISSSSSNRLVLALVLMLGAAPRFFSTTPPGRRLDGAYSKPADLPATRKENRIDFTLPQEAPGQDWAARQGQERPYAMPGRRAAAKLVD
jgi:hypothetical protein